MSDVIIIETSETIVITEGPGGSGAASSTPTGTGYRHVTADVEDAATTTLASLKTQLGLTGTNSGDQDLSGYQPVDSDLTAIAALTTTAYGRSLLTLADAAANKTAILAALGLTGLTVGGSSITFTAAGGSIELPIG